MGARAAGLTAALCAASDGATAPMAIALPVPSRNVRREILRSMRRIIIAGVFMDRGFLAELRRIVGGSSVVDDPLQLLTYECDALPHLRASPGAVVLPGSAAEVQAIVRLCARE